MSRKKFSRYNLDPHNLSINIPDDIKTHIVSLVNTKEAQAKRIMKDEFDRQLGDQLTQNYQVLDLDYGILYSVFRLYRYDEINDLQEQFIEKLRGVNNLNKILEKLDILSYQTATSLFIYKLRKIETNIKQNNAGELSIELLQKSIDEYQKFFLKINKNIKRLNKMMSDLQKNFNITIKQRYIDDINSKIKIYNQMKHKFRFSKNKKIDFIELAKLKELYPNQRYLSSRKSSRSRSRTRSRLRSRTRSRTRLTRKIKSL